MSYFSKNLILRGKSKAAKEKIIKYAERKNIKIGEKEISSIKIYFLKDGGYYLIGQSFDENTGYANDMYAYSDIYVSRFSESGEHLWDSKIPRQWPIIGYNLGFKSTIKHDELYFVFLDNVLNINEHNINNMGAYSTFRFKSKTNIYSQVFIDSLGNTKRTKIYDPRNKGFKIFNILSSEDKYNRIIWLSYNGRYNGKKNFSLFKFYH
jgi:hypothetical protein